MKGIATSILLVTQSRGLTEVVTRLFEHQGSSVLTVSSLEACAHILLFQSNRFRHIVVDATLTRGVRMGELVDIHASGVPLIVLTSETDLHGLYSLFPADTTNFLDKPFRPSSLLGLAKKQRGSA